MSNTTNKQRKCSLIVFCILVIASAIGRTSIPAFASTINKYKCPDNGVNMPLIYGCDNAQGYGYLYARYKLSDTTAKVYTCTYTGNKDDNCSPFPKVVGTYWYYKLITCPIPHGYEPYANYMENMTRSSCR